MAPARPRALHGPRARVVAVPVAAVPVHEGGRVHARRHHPGWHHAVPVVLQGRWGTVPGRHGRRARGRGGRRHSGRGSRRRRRLDRTRARRGQSRRRPEVRGGHGRRGRRVPPRVRGHVVRGRHGHPRRHGRPVVEVGLDVLLEILRVERVGRRCRVHGPVRLRGRGVERGDAPRVVQRGMVVPVVQTGGGRVRRALRRQVLHLVHLVRPRHRRRGRPVALRRGRRRRRVYRRLGRVDEVHDVTAVAAVGGVDAVAVEVIVVVVVVVAANAVLLLRRRLTVSRFLASRSSRGGRGARRRGRRRRGRRRCCWCRRRLHLRVVRGGHEIVGRVSLDCRRRGLHFCLLDRLISTNH